MSNKCSAKLAAFKGSPQKVNLLANAIKGMTVEQASVFLQFSDSRFSRIFLKLLESAIANGENNHDLDIDSLVVSEVRVGKAFVLKRFRARARGRGSRILKPFSCLEIILTSKVA